MRKEVALRANADTDVQSPIARTRNRAPKTHSRHKIVSHKEFVIFIGAGAEKMAGFQEGWSALIARPS